MLQMFTIDQLRKMPRPPEYLDELRACAVRVTDAVMEFETDAECYIALQKKYGTYNPSPPPIPEPAPIRKSRGLGDTVARLTKAVGIKPCGGCKKRQAALNNLLPYKP